jgi:hypothetical protein
MDEWQLIYLGSIFFFIHVTKHLIYPLFNTQYRQKYIHKQNLSLKFALHRLLLTGHILTVHELTSCKGRTLFYS